MTHTGSQPSFVCADSGFRAILARADADLPPLPAPTHAPVETANQLVPVSTQMHLTTEWRAAMSKLFGNDVAWTAVSLVGAAVVAASALHALGITGTPAAPVADTSSRQAASFATPALVAPGASIEAPTEIIAAVGSHASLPLGVVGADRPSMLRLRGLPAYAGLSVGTPLDGGTWLVDVRAARDLKIVSYATTPEPQDVSIELLGESGQPRAEAHTRVQIVALTPSPVEVVTAAAIQPAPPAVAETPAPIVVQRPHPEADARPAPKAKPRPATAQPQVAPRSEPRQEARAKPAPIIVQQRTPAPMPVAPTLFAPSPAPPITAAKPAPAPWMRSALGMNQLENGP